MVSKRNIGTEVRQILYESDKHALSAQEVADEIEDCSRQYVDRHLRSMAEGSGSIKRVELGPSVGYYWDHDSIELLESDFEGRSINRPTAREPMPVLCMGCERTLGVDDELLTIYERVNHTWELVQTACSDHLADERVDNLVQALLSERYISDALEDVGMGFAVVLGTLSEGSIYDRENDRTMYTHVHEDVSVLQVLRPRGLSIGPEFSDQDAK